MRSQRDSIWGHLNQCGVVKHWATLKGSDCAMTKSTIRNQIPNESEVNLAMLARISSHDRCSRGFKHTACAFYIHTPSRLTMPMNAAQHTVAQIQVWCMLWIIIFYCTFKVSAVTHIMVQLWRTGTFNNHHSPACKHQHHINMYWNCTKRSLFWKVAVWVFHLFLSKIMKWILVWDGDRISTTLEMVLTMRLPPCIIHLCKPEFSTLVIK